MFSLNKKNVLSKDINITRLTIYFVQKNKNKNNTLEQYHFQVFSYCFFVTESRFTLLHGSELRYYADSKNVLDIIPSVGIFSTSKHLLHYTLY